MDCPYVYREDVYDFIIDQADDYNGAVPIIPVCEKNISDQYTIQFMERAGAPALSIYNYTYTAIPTVYSLLAELYLDASCITPVLNNEALGLNGRGVIVGFVDSGINLTSESFQYVGGGTRVMALWDQNKPEEAGSAPQTAPATGTQPGVSGEVTASQPPEATASQSAEATGYLGYGRVYRQKQINEALEDPETTRALPRDELGHGSFLAGIVAGTNGGIAPQADIAVVKLKQCKQYLREFYKIPVDTPCYQETDVMAGIQFLKDYAKEVGKPLVLCFCLGTNMGSHTGNAFLGQMLNRMNLTNGNMVVCAAGNEALNRHHYSGLVEQQGESEEVEIQVEEGCMGFWVECWSQVPQAFYIHVISPSGEKMEGVVAQVAGEKRHRFVLENTLVVQSARYVYQEGGEQIIFTSFDKPTPGIWKLQVYGKVVTTGIYNLWLPMEEQLSKPVIFLQADPDTTITEPGNALSILTVTAYDGQSGGLFIRSGRGYTASQQIKPDLAAPGVNVISPYENRVDSSTCAATAITAGAAALYLQWINYVRQGLPVTGNAVKQGLILGANTRPEESYPNREWGYGTLCLLNTLRL